VVIAPARTVTAGGSSTNDVVAGSQRAKAASTNKRSEVLPQRSELGHDASELGHDAHRRGPAPRGAGQALQLGPRRFGYLAVCRGVGFIGVRLSAGGVAICVTSVACAPEA
jgi:hypothetical protein